MSTDGRQSSPQSWEHLLEKDPNGGAGFRLGIAAAVLIHAGIFAVTWPTIAQAPPEVIEDNLIPFPITRLAPPERPPEPIRIEVPQPPTGNPVIPGPPEKPIDVVERPPVDVIEIPDVPIACGPEPDDLPPPPVVEKTTVLAGVDIDEPKLIHKVEPRYTEPARYAGIRGPVILELIIGTDGEVESVTLLRGLPLGLTKSAVDAVKQWRFQPSTYHSKPVSVRYILTIHFNLT